MQFQPRALAALTGFALICSGAAAGDLDPPGPPASTPAIEPRIAISQENTPGDASFFFRIDEPGSYYAPGNLFNATPASPRNGILIEASDVTIDLSGFKLDGQEPQPLSLEAPPRPLGPAPPTTGIVASGAIENITIRNGTIRDWTGDGMDLYAASGCLIEDVIVTACGGTGMTLSAFNVVRDCVVRSNGGIGLLFENFNCVRDSVFFSNDGGMRVGGLQNSVTGNAITSNGPFGITVAGLGTQRNIIRDNTVAGGNTGILLDDIDPEDNVVIHNTITASNMVDLSDGGPDNLILGNSGTGFYLGVTPTTTNPTGAWINAEE